MAWASWKTAFGNLSLRNGGDAIEARAANHGMDVTFPNYETLWRHHVAPATQRPFNIHFRAATAPVIAKIGMLSHSLLDDLVKAADSLAKVRLGDFGPTFRNCTDAIKSDGDALQKFTDLQETIEKELGRALRQNLTQWSKADWDTKWGPAREKIVTYRNFLTHMGRPGIIMVKQASGADVPYVLHQDYVVRGKYLTWPEQEVVYQTTPSKWAPLADVCDELHRDTMKWLDGAYGEAARVLSPLVTNVDYQRLWGWDLTKAGAAAWQIPAPPPAAPSGGAATTYSSQVSGTLGQNVSGQMNP